MFACRCPHMCLGRLSRVTSLIHVLTGVGVQWPASRGDGCRVTAEMVVVIVIVIIIIILIVTCSSSNSNRS